MTNTEMATRWGRKIRVLRRERELTATAVAKQAGVSRRHYHRIEAGLHVPGDEVRVRIAAALAVDPNELFDLKAAS